MSPIFKLTRLFETSMFHKRRKEANRTSRPATTTTPRPKPLFQLFSAMQVHTNTDNNLDIP